MFFFCIRDIILIEHFLVFFSIFPVFCSILNFSNARIFLMLLKLILLWMVNIYHYIRKCVKNVPVNGFSSTFSKPQHHVDPVLSGVRRDVTRQ